MDYLSIDEIKLLLAQIPDNTRNSRRDLAMLALLYDCGARVQELINLSPSCVRFEIPYNIRLTGKGRHTSTRREMVLMDRSGVLIDTPGVREFGLAINDTDSLAEMLEISDYAESCRFKDCEHINEPSCAVLEAVNNGTLDRKVYESYLKLRREAWHFSTSEHEKRKRDKSFSKIIDEVKKRKANL